MEHDVIIIGGGPGGATAALVLARAGMRVLVLEKAAFPRFHLGESILPRGFRLIGELGLSEALLRLPHVDKFGAEFGMGDDTGNSTQFTFEDNLLPGSVTFNIERSYLDQMLLDEAQSAGADVRQKTSVKRIAELGEGSVAVETSDGTTFRGRMLLDASGDATVVGRHLGTRRRFADPVFGKVAYFEHFDNVERLPGKAQGHPSIFMCTEGWFWIIGLNETKTSVGFVANPDLAKRINVSPSRLLQWAVARCPVVRHRMRNARGPATNRIVSDFSYECSPLAGPGYFLIGDAGCFLDPIFSTGVTLAMMGGKQAAEQTLAVLRDGRSPSRARTRYIRFVKNGTSVFRCLIRNYYQHSFRELFLNGTGPLQIHRAVLSVLAGDVFPRLQWKLRWRMQLLWITAWLNRFLPMVPRRKEFSLMDAEPNDLDLLEPALSQPAES
jgi:flavin-dependent dehydrogenase